jgi:hypothetical protein
MEGNHAADASKNNLYAKHKKSRSKLLFGCISASYRFWIF